MEWLTCRFDVILSICVGCLLKRQKKNLQREKKGRTPKNTGSEDSNKRRTLQITPSQSKIKTSTLSNNSLWGSDNLETCAICRGVLLVKERRWKLAVAALAVTVAAVREVKVRGAKAAAVRAEASHMVVDTRALENFIVSSLCIKSIMLWGTSGTVFCRCC